VAVLSETGVCDGLPTVVWRIAHPEQNAATIAMAPVIQFRPRNLGVSFPIGTNN